MQKQSDNVQERLQQSDVDTIMYTAHTHTLTEVAEDLVELADVQFDSVILQTIPNVHTSTNINKILHFMCKNINKKENGYYNVEQCLCDEYCAVLQIRANTDSTCKS